MNDRLMRFLAWLGRNEIGAWVALAAFLCLTIAANASFISQHHRLPQGGGELLNWLLGLQ